MNSRKHERSVLNQSINIIDMLNGGGFGELINISPEGLMVMTESEVPTHSIYQLELELPAELIGSNRISLGADCLWCRQAENFDRYWAGFQIIDVSDQALQQIEKLIESYSE